MDKHKRIKAAREGSMVERCHTVRHLGSYTNGQHSFDMLTLALELIPEDELSKDLMKAIIYHDLPERWTGDVPHPMKVASTSLEDVLIWHENEIKESMGWGVVLAPDEHMWLQSLDRLEFYLWTSDQLILGNENVNEIYRRMHKLMCEDRHPQVVNVAQRYSPDRLSDDIPE